MTVLGLSLAAVHLLYLTCLVPPSHAGSAISLQATPSTVLDGLTPSLTISCSLNKTASSSSVIGRRDVTSSLDNMAEVTSIILMKNGSDVASVSHTSPAHLVGSPANVHVSGSVARGGGTDGFLQLTFQDPNERHTGEFVCEVNAVSPSGHTVTFSASQEVAMTTPTTADLVSYVRQLKRENDQLKAKVDTKVFFSAGRTSPLTASASTVVVFDHVFANVGGAFSPTSGEFVCPVAGYYEFEFSMLSQYEQTHYAHLLHNRQTVVAIYGRAGSVNQEDSSNSATIKLSKGDVVNVQLNSGVIYNNHDDIYSAFSGKLVALV